MMHMRREHHVITRPCHVYTTAASDRVQAHRRSGHEFTIDTQREKNNMGTNGQQANRRFDRIVIGAGAMGSAAAYHLAKRGLRVLLVEQFHVGHDRGGSAGQTRIIRYSHSEPTYARIMPAVYALWRELEAEYGEPLLLQAGTLNLASAPVSEKDDYLQQCIDTMAALGYAHELLDGDTLRQRYPQLRLDDGWRGMWQPQGGALAVKRCIRAQVQGAVNRGAVLRESTRVLSVEPSGNGVCVRLADARTNGAGGEETIHAGGAVIAAGPWASRLLDSLLARPVRLRVTHQQVAYYRASDPALFQPNRLPIYLFSSAPFFYGFPIWEQPGQVKLSVELESTPDGIDADATHTIDEVALAMLSERVAAHFPGLDPAPVRADACRYTHSPDEQFIIDRHPQHAQIAIAAGFSGRGFKFTHAVGSLLADLSTTPPGSYDSPFWLDEFRLARFGQEQPQMNADEHD